MTTTFSQLGLQPELVQAVAGLGFADADAHPGRHDPGHAGRSRCDRSGADRHRQDRRLRPAHSPQPEPETNHIQSLVLTPTRELAVQVAKAMHEFGRPLGVRVLPVYGGEPYGRQISRLQKGVDVVVGTPGRLIDLIEREVLDLSRVQ
jgi:ATP-dependent RNA helicase DeaD